MYFVIINYFYILVKLKVKHIPDFLQVISESHREEAEVGIGNALLLWYPMYKAILTVNQTEKMKKCVVYYNFNPSKSILYVTQTDTRCYFKPILLGYRVL